MDTLQNKIDTYEMQNYTYKTQGVVLRLLAAASSSCRALRVQRNTELWSLARWQEAASWHHTCSSTTASDQRHSDAVLTSFAGAEKKKEIQMKARKKRLEGRVEQGLRREKWKAKVKEKGWESGAEE